MFSRAWSAARAILAGLALVLLGVWAPPGAAAAQEPAPPDQNAFAQMIDSQGQHVGLAALRQTADGVEITVQTTGLSPGEHGIHIHAVGACDPPGFTTAGDHFNPQSQQHGLRNTFGPHAGDLPNLPVGTDGTGAMMITTNRVTLGPGGASLLDEDGSAIVVHAGWDNQASDPAGNSGDRVACGVLRQAAPGQ